MEKPAKFPSQIQERFIVRMPDGLRDRIAAAAAAANRPMNSEIVATLLERYPARSVEAEKRAIVDLLLSAATAAEFEEKGREANRRFEAMGLPWRVEMSPDRQSPGKVTFAKDPKKPLPPAKD